MNGKKTLEELKAESKHILFVQYPVKELPEPIFSKPIYIFNIYKKEMISKIKYIVHFHNEYLLFFKDAKKIDHLPNYLIFLENEVCVDWISSKMRESLNNDGNNLGFKLVKKFKESIHLVTDKLDVYQSLYEFFRTRISFLNFHTFYQSMKKIGKGTFAKVYLVNKINSKEKTSYASKAFNKESLNIMNKGIDSLKNEINIMHKLTHENIMKLYEVYETSNSFYLVMELCTGGNLLDFIRQNGKCSEQIAAVIIGGVLKGVTHMHSKGIMHRDFKPDNIVFKKFLDEQTCFNVCIADFGLAANISDKNFIFFKCGTPGYVAPEILNNENRNIHYNEKCDIFSIGVILHILLLGISPFNGEDYSIILRQNKLCLINFNSFIYQKITKEALHLLTLMLEVNPSKRISAQECLNHVFFEKDRPMKAEYDFEESIEEHYATEFNSIAKKLKSEIYRSKTLVLGSERKINFHIGSDKKLNYPLLQKSDDIGSKSLFDVMRSEELRNLLMTTSIINGHIKTLESFTDYGRKLDIHKKFEIKQEETESPDLRASLYGKKFDKNEKNEKTFNSDSKNIMYNSIKESEEEHKL